MALSSQRPFLLHRAVLSARGLLKRGFTLIEMIVICAILVFISGIVLANNNQFGGVVQLENLAYDIALTVRQAQVYGISVARFGNNDFTSGYGMHFSLSEPRSFRLYGDADNDGLYTTGEMLDGGETQIKGNFAIVKLCVIDRNGSTDCGVTTLDMLFKRPEPDAWISYSTGGAPSSCTLQSANCAYQGCVTVRSPQGQERGVVVNINGQISVRKACQ